MRTTERVPEYAAEQDVSEEEPLKKGVEATAKEFVDEGEEVCAKP
jgi:hypothetical protein